MSDTTSDLRVHPTGAAKFAERLDWGLRVRSMTQGRLAEITGLHPRTVSGYVRGIAQPTAPSLQAVARALGISGSYLLCLTDDPEGA